MFDKISLRALCTFEKNTGKNAMELFAKESKSACDLRDLVWLIMFSKDNKVTFDNVEDLSGAEFEAQLKSISEEPAVKV